MLSVSTVHISKITKKKSMLVKNNEDFRENSYHYKKSPTADKHYRVEVA